MGVGPAPVSVAPHSGVPGRQLWLDAVYCRLGDTRLVCELYRPPPDQHLFPAGVPPAIAASALIHILSTLSTGAAGVRISILSSDAGCSGGPAVLSVFRESGWNRFAGVVYR